MLRTAIARLLVRGFLFRPARSFLVCYTLVTIAVAAPRTALHGGCLAIAAPWLAIGLLLLNLPLLSAAFRGFRLTPAERRNHALEHATIFFLRQRYGRRGRLAGQAFADGFHLSGVADAADIRQAFRQATAALERGEGSCAVSRRCGSMMVTAQALGVTALMPGAVATLVGPPRVAEVLTAAAGAAFLLLRFPIGLWLQRRRFLSFDFESPSIVSIDPAKPRPMLDRPGVFFVRTRMTPKGL
jgi:hypothetical protein